MPAQPDDRKLDSYEIEYIPNGLKKIGVNSNGLPKFVYLGDNAVIAKTTKYILADEQYYLDEAQNLAQNASNITFGSGNVKIRN